MRHQHARFRIPARRWAPTAAAAAAAVVLTACGGPVAAAGDVREGPAEGDAIEVVALDNSFDLAEVAFEPGTEVTIEVTNEGDAPHNLVIDDPELSTGTLESGEVATATFTAPEGAVTFYCSFHPGMKGELRPTGS